MNKYLTLIVGGIIGLFIGLFLARVDIDSLDTSENQSQIEGSITVSQYIAQPNTTPITCSDVSLDEGSTVWNLLQHCSKVGDGYAIEHQEYKGLGILVTTIGNNSGGNENRYWQFWVNAKHASRGVTDYQLSDHDVVVWEFLPLSIEE